MANQLDQLSLKYNSIKEEGTKLIQKELSSLHSDYGHSDNEKKLYDVFNEVKTNLSGIDLSETPLLKNIYKNFRDLSTKVKESEELEKIIQSVDSESNVLPQISKAIRFVSEEENKDKLSNHYDHTKKGFNRILAYTLDIAKKIQRNLADGPVKKLYDNWFEDYSKKYEVYDNSNIKADIEDKSKNALDELITLTNAFATVIDVDSLVGITKTEPVPEAKPDVTNVPGKPAKEVAKYDIQINKFSHYDIPEMGYKSLASVNIKSGADAEIAQNLINKAQKEQGNTDPDQILYDTLTSYLTANLPVITDELGIRKSKPRTEKIVQGLISKSIKFTNGNVHDILVEVANKFNNPSYQFSEKYADCAKVVFKPLHAAKVRQEWFNKHKAQKTN
jgi:hypothetical protein